MSRDPRESPLARLTDTLPAPDSAASGEASGVTRLEDAPPALAEEIRRRMAELDGADSGAVIRFGSRAQAGLQEISQAMLADVRSKEVGPAGDGLRALVTTIRGFSTTQLDLRAKRTWLERLTGRAAPIARFVASYQTVQAQIDRIAGDLEAREHQLLKDVKALDLLYDRTLAFYDELALYIAAGEAKLAEIDSDAIPRLEADLSAAPEGEAMLRAQALRDARARRDDLERRVHDLKLTRQVTMQALPSIRLVQENDKALIARIDSTLVNTVPLWETQLAQAVTIQRSAEAAQAVKAAGDLTNELLAANARNLRTAKAATRAGIERGVFDIQTVRAANAELIETIEDSLRIAGEGRTARAEAEAELTRLEAELRRTLAASQARDAAPRGTPRP